MFLASFHITVLIANEPSERRRLDGKAAPE